MEQRYRHISIAIPALDELDNMPLLIEMLRQQTFKDFSIYFCINQPDSWWTGSPLEQRICIANRNTIDYLRDIKGLEVKIIDRSSYGNGWSGKRKGVGWARKVAMEEIYCERSSNELVVSLDADTAFGPDYLQQVLDTMNAAPDASALAVPYYHPLEGWEHADRSILRYECYMRYYLIHLLEIHNPYAFSALGSAMVYPLWAYKRVGGITPLQGGEDFYLLQKFCKTGTVLLHTEGRVYPQGRISHRVPFGTGPAVASGLEVQIEKYPFYSPEGFEAVGQTYELLPQLYEQDIETPMSEFMRQQLRTHDLWGPLRRNFKTLDRFVNACQERLDGLRILQYLKQFPTEEQFFTNMLRRYEIPYPEDFSFASTPIEQLDTIRNHLYKLELMLRKSEQ